MRDPDGHRTELLLPGMQIIDIDDEPMMCPVKSNASSNLWGCPRQRAGWKRQRILPVWEVTQTIDGSPMTAERYLAEKKESADSRAV